VQAAIVAQTHDIHRFVHAMSPREYRYALDVDPYVILHTVEQHARRFAQDLASRQIYVASTLATDDILRIEFEPERLDEPPYALVIPPRERETATDKAAIQRMHDALVQLIVPHNPVMYPVVLVLTYVPATQAVRLHQLERQVKILHEAGVPILLGSDSGNWEVFPWVFHGPTSVHELELLVEAGLSPLDAIIAATSTPARMLGMQAELGEVAVGFAADLVVLPTDPLTDIRAFRSPRLVVQDGVAQTPEAWMAAP